MNFAEVLRFRNCRSCFLISPANNSSAHQPRDWANDSEFKQFFCQRRL